MVGDSEHHRRERPAHFRIQVEYQSNQAKARLDLCHAFSLRPALHVRNLTSEVGMGSLSVLFSFTFPRPFLVSPSG